MKNSEVVAKLLAAYCFQEGRHADKTVVRKAEHLITRLAAEADRNSKEG